MLQELTLKNIPIGVVETVSSIMDHRQEILLTNSREDFVESKVAELTDRYAREFTKESEEFDDDKNLVKASYACPLKKINLRFSFDYKDFGIFDSFLNRLAQKGIKISLTDSKGDCAAHIRPSDLAALVRKKSEEKESWRKYETL